ncbi:MAG: prepilin-type N-terminal cleavage/methylation domain-containing protein [candidate division NC10 bacterium]|nr:prepilin-type N-terminal cleavage/methylation domain-containing protein [candidate division NC10 bacterium]
MSREAGYRADQGKGFTLVEVLVAMTVLAVGLLAISGMVPTAYTNISMSGVDTRGIGFAQERLDQLRLEPWTSTALTAGSHTDTAPASGYTRSYLVEDNAPMSGVKRLTVTVTGYRGRQVILQTLITN